MLMNFGESQKLKVEFFIRAVDELLENSEVKENFVSKLMPAIIHANDKKIAELIAELQNEALKRKIDASSEPSDKDTYKFLLALREFESGSFADAIYTCMLILKSQYIPRNDVLKIISRSVDGLLKQEFSKLAPDDKEAIKDGISILLKLTNENYNSVKLKAEYAKKNKQFAVSLQYFLKAYELLNKDDFDYDVAVNIAKIASKLDTPKSVRPVVEQALKHLNSKRKAVKDAEELGKLAQKYVELSVQLATIYLATGEGVKAEALLSGLHNMMPKNEEIISALAEARIQSPPEVFEDLVSTLKDFEKKYQTEEEREAFIRQELKQVEILCDMKNRPDLAREILIRLPDEYLHPQSEVLSELQAFVQLRLGFCNLLLGIGEIEENYQKCKQAYEQYSDNPMFFSIYLFVLASAGRDEEIAGLLLDENWQNSMIENNAMPQQLLDFTKNFEHLIEEGDFEAAGEELKALKQFIDPRMQFMHAPLMLHSTFLYGPLPPKITKDELIESFEGLEQTWNKIPQLYRAMNGLEFYMFLWQASQKPFSVDSINLSDTPPLGRLFNEIVIKAWFEEAFFNMRDDLPTENFEPTMESWFKIARKRYSAEDQLGLKIAMTFSAISKKDGEDIFDEEGFKEFSENFIKFGLTEMEAVGTIIDDAESKPKDTESGLPFDNSEMMRIQIRLVFTIFPIIRFLTELKLNKPELFYALQEEIVPQFSFGFEVFNYVEKTF